MRTEKTSISIRSILGDTKTHSLTLKHYESVNEALEAIGEEETLKLINYASSLVQRDKRRREVLARGK